MGVERAVKSTLDDASAVRAGSSGALSACIVTSL